MRREFRTPVWRNKHKESVICKIAIIDDDENEAEHNGKINKFSDGEKINPDWTTLINEYSIEDIDKLTEEFDKEQQEILEKKNEIEKEEITRSKERNYQEKLYERKMELFELPEIKESKNRSAKSKIRKAKSKVEAMIFATQLIIQNENEDEKPPESDE